MKLRPVIYSLSILAVVSLCSQTLAIRIAPTWQELQESSDFLVWAKVTKIEEVSDGRYETTYTVLRTYKGESPKNLTVTWTLHSGLSMNRRYHCSIMDMSADFIIFAKEVDDGYAMYEERFMRKLKNGLTLSSRATVRVNGIKELPEELELKIVKEQSQDSDYVRQYLEWEEIKAWLDNNYPAYIDTAVDQALQPNMKTPVDSGAEQGTAAEI